VVLVRVQFCLCCSGYQWDYQWQVPKWLMYEWNLMGCNISNWVTTIQQTRAFSIMWVSAAPLYDKKCVMVLLIHLCNVTQAQSQLDCCVNAECFIYVYINACTQCMQWTLTFYHYSHVRSIKKGHMINYTNYIINTSHIVHSLQY
jgi:hypothetical protein